MGTDDGVPPSPTLQAKCAAAVPARPVRPERWALNDPEGGAVWAEGNCSRGRKGGGVGIHGIWPRCREGTHGVERTRPSPLPLTRTEVTERGGEGRGGMRADPPRVPASVALRSSGIMAAPAARWAPCSTL